MRITFLGNFRVDYSSESHHKKSLESLGHEVSALQETEATSELILDSALNSDVFVWVHTHGWVTPTVTRMSMKTVLEVLRSKGIPTVSYHLDLWIGINRQSDLVRDPMYKSIEYFFTVDKQMADWFNQNTKVKGHYLPAGVFGEECYWIEGISPNKDVVFVGSREYHREWPWRHQLIDWLKRTYGDRFTHVGKDGTGIVRGHDLNNLYTHSKVAVGDSLIKNFTYEYYWSDRLYETIGRGGFIIFPYIKGLEDEFVLEDEDELKQELVTYKLGDFDDLKRKIDYYVEHDEEREAIRRRGFDKVVNNYTYKHRWQTILETISVK